MNLKELIAATVETYLSLKVGTDKLERVVQCLYSSVLHLDFFFFPCTMNDGSENLIGFDR
jgi:hypothetical protein